MIIVVLVSISNLIYNSEVHIMDVEVNKFGVNKAIQAYILADEQMKAAGFRLITNCKSAYWYYGYDLKFPKEYRSADIAFSVSIPVDGTDIQIDVIDEDFGQPYDYQRYLESTPTFTFALIVKEQVELQMQKLQEAGVLSGHKYGEYI